MKTYLDTYIDLHMHTQASDGTWTPDDVIEQVTKANIETFSVTDHDSLDSVEETQNKAKESGLKCITGVELSSSHKNMEYHILAYDFKLDHPSIVNRINKNNKQRYDYHFTVVNQLKDDFENISIEEFRQYKYDLSRGGWLSLNYLIDKRIVHTMQDFFNLMKDYKLQLVFETPDIIISDIKAAGGIAILAHPAAYAKENLMPSKALKEWLALGIEGLECYSPYYKNPLDCSYYINFCNDHNLFISGGSDCHGDLLPQRKLRTPSIKIKELNLPFLLNE